MAAGREELEIQDGAAASGGLASPVQGNAVARNEAFFDNPERVFGVVAVISLCGLFYYSVVFHDPLFALIFAQVPLGLALMFRSPFLVSILFVTFCFFRIHEAVPFFREIRVPFYLSVLSITGFGLWAWLADRSEMRFQTQLKAFLVFAVLVTVGIPFSWDPDRSFEAWSDSFVKVIVMTIICALIAERPRHLTVTAFCFVAGGIILSCLLMWNKIYKIGLVEGTRAVVLPNSKSLLGDPNDIALVILCSFAISSALAIMRGDWITRALAAMATVIIAGGLISTQSRGGMLGVLIVLLVIVLWRTQSRLLAGLVLGLVFVGLSVSMGLGSRSSGSEFMAGGLDESAGNRLVAWRAALKMATAHPFNGIGLSGFTPNFYDYADAWVDHAMAVHSSWFEVLGETGFLGLAAFVTMVALVGRSIYRDLKIVSTQPEQQLLQALALGLLAAYCSFLVSGSFVTHGFTWPIYGLLVASAILEKCAGALARPRQALSPVVLSTVVEKAAEQPKWPWLRLGTAGIATGRPLAALSASQPQIV